MGRFGFAQLSSGSASMGYFLKKQDSISSTSHHIVGCDDTTCYYYTNSLHMLAVLKNIDRDLIKVPCIENAIDFALSYDILW